jgi:hypothetical protein
MNKQTSSIPIFDLDGAKPQFHNPTGSRIVMNVDNCPILAGIGAVLLRLQKGRVREHLSLGVEHNSNDKEKDRIDWHRSKVQELSSKGNSWRNSTNTPSI